MKTSELKQIIKESVKEVIQDELKHVLLEIIKIQSSVISKVPVQEVNNFGETPKKSSLPSKQPINNTMGVREKYMEAINESLFHNDEAPMEFRPNMSSADLGNGEISDAQMNKLLGMK